MPLRMFNGYVAFDRRRDIVFLPYAIPQVTFAESRRDPILAEAFQYEDQYGAENLMTADQGNLGALVNDHILVLAHGDRRVGFAASGHEDRGLKATTAAGIAEALVARGLRANYSGNILVWTCFSGVAGGFADSVARALRGQGRRQCSVYGAVGPTGMMGYLPAGPNDLRGLKVVTNRLAAGGLLDTVSTGTTSVRTWHGIMTLATADDLRLADSRAGLRSAEL
jgi:hypothetical protein